MTKAAALFLGRGSRQGLWAIPALLLVIGVIWLSISTDQFASSQNLSNLLSQAMPLLIVALGQMLVILIGGLDLSVGAVISLTTAILALAAPDAVTIPLVFAAAVAIGCVNGLAVTRLNVNPIIATLAVQMIVMGIVRILRPVAGGTVPEVIIFAVTGNVFGIPLALFWAVGAIGLAWKILHGSRLGLHLFAIGGGVASGHVEATRTFGVNDRSAIMMAYILSSCFAALAGVFIAGRIVSGDPNVGPPFALDAITAVAIGGTLLSGGVGSLRGVLIGAALLAVLSNGMNMVNLSPFVQTAVKGTLLLAVVAMQTRKKIGL